MLTNKQIKALAVKKLQTKEVQSIKKNVCGIFPDKKNIKACESAFSKEFIKSFTDSYKQTHHH